MAEQDAKPISLKIDGLTSAEFQALSEEEMDGLVFCDHPVAFHIGSAEILGQFRKFQNRIEIELAHIEGGGEGALPLIWKLASSYARLRRFENIDWYVHAVNCANPNPKLQRVLLRKKFAIVEKDGVDVFYLNQKLAEQSVVPNP